MTFVMDRAQADQETSVSRFIYLSRSQQGNHVGTEPAQIVIPVAPSSPPVTVDFQRWGRNADGRHFPAPGLEVFKAKGVKARTENFQQQIVFVLPDGCDPCEV